METNNYHLKFSSEAGGLALFCSIATRHLQHFSEYSGPISKGHSRLGGLADYAQGVLGPGLELLLQSSPGNEKLKLSQSMLVHTYIQGYAE
jgi:hypothetical protein